MQQAATRGIPRFGGTSSKVWNRSDSGVRATSFWDFLASGKIGGSKNDRMADGCSCKKKARENWYISWGISIGMSTCFFLKISRVVFFFFQVSTHHLECLQLLCWCFFLLFPSHSTTTNLRLLWTEKPQWSWKIWRFYQVGNSCLSKLPACWIVEFDIVKPSFFRWVDWEGSLTPTSKMGFYTKALASAFVSPRGCEGIVPGFNRWWLRLVSLKQ